MIDGGREFLSDPFREQRIWAEGAAYARLDRFDVLEVVGPDAAAFLTALWSQSLDLLPEGGSAEALLLDAAGHLEAQAAVVRESSDAFLLLVEPDEGERLVVWLDSMRFRMRVAVRLASPELTAVAVSGGATGLLPDLGPGLRASWTDPWAAVVPGGTQYSADSPARDAYRMTIAVLARDTEAETRRRLEGAGAVEVGWGAPEAARIEAWRPRLGTEGVTNLIPHEVDLLRTAVHLAKGCYRGQETVAKVHNLGHPPRRLVFLHLDGSDGGLPVHGDLVVAGSAEVGVVTAAVRHWELGPIALALVRRQTDPTAVLSVLHGDGAPIAATQQVIVPVGAGGVAHSDVVAFRAARRGRTD